MTDKVREVFEALDIDAESAVRLADSFLLQPLQQDEFDSVNRARTYALVKLQRYSEAIVRSTEIYVRTGSHKDLHQIGYVQRSSGDYAAALATFEEERSKIDPTDRLASAINLYELICCNHLLKQTATAEALLVEYEQITFANEDLIERACFFRLKGDICQDENPTLAKQNYIKSRDHFLKAGDVEGANDIDHKLQRLG